MKKLIEILFKIKRYFARKRFRKIANKKYRVVQTDPNRFEIQVYQQTKFVKGGDNVCYFEQSGYHPMIIDNISNYCADVNKFRSVCNNLRYNYYIDLIREYDKKMNEKIKSFIYPKVVY